MDGASPFFLRRERGDRPWPIHPCEGRGILGPMGIEEIRTDCRHFRGEFPCRFRRTCPGCEEYSPMGRRVLIVKMGALGDVLRTTPILRRLRGEVGPVHITWLTAPEAMPLLSGNPFLDRLLLWGVEALVCLDAERFHQVICLDKAPEAAALAARVKAEERLGFGLDANGSLVPLNRESEYAYILGLDDELKFRKNRWTYQEITFGQLGWVFRGEEYAFFLNDGERKWAEKRLRGLGLAHGRGAVGLAVGAGSVFANKTWPPWRWASLARLIQREMDREVILLVGPEEVALGEEVRRHMGASAAPMSGGDHGIREFAALIERCACAVSGDTLAMHLAIAVGTPVVALFGPTCAREVELYGRGVKLVSPKPCSPCYRRQCDLSPTCVEEISEEEVLRAVGDLVGGPDGGPP